VSGFVDQQKNIGPGVVEAVARDFDLMESSSSAAARAAVATPGTDGFNLVEALRSLANLADRLRQEEDKDLPSERRV